MGRLRWQGVCGCEGEGEGEGEEGEEGGFHFGVVAGARGVGRFGFVSEDDGVYILEGCGDSSALRMQPGGAGEDSATYVHDAWMLATGKSVQY